MVEVLQQRPQNQTDKQRQCDKDGQEKQILDIQIAVISGNAFAHGVDAIGKREQRMQLLEKLRHHFDGVRAGRTRNLQDD